MGQLIRGQDGGGTRYILDNQPVYCGTRLELRLPGGHWTHVFFEMEDDRGVLYLVLGGAWEDWKPPEGKHEGDEIEVSCKDCDGLGRLKPGASCQECGGLGEVKLIRQQPGDSLTMTCSACGGSGRVKKARKCGECNGRGTRWREVQRPRAPAVVLRPGYACELDRAELRWPGRRP